MRRYRCGKPIRPHAGRANLRCTGAPRRVWPSLAPIPILCTSCAPKVLSGYWSCCWPSACCRPWPSPPTTEPTAEDVVAGRGSGAWACDATRPPGRQRLRHRVNTRDPVTVTITPDTGPLQSVSHRVNAHRRTATTMFPRRPRRGTPRSTMSAAAIPNGVGSFMFDRWRRCPGRRRVHDRPDDRGRVLDARARLYAAARPPDLQLLLRGHKHGPFVRHFPLPPRRRRPSRRPRPTPTARLKPTAKPTATPTTGHRDRRRQPRARQPRAPRPRLRRHRERVRHGDRDALAEHARAERRRHHLHAGAVERAAGAGRRGRWRR